MFYVCAHDTTLHAAVAFCTALVRAARRARSASRHRSSIQTSDLQPPGSQNDKLADSSQPVILRIASASYLASFLVRQVGQSCGALVWRPRCLRYHTTTQARSSFLSSAFVLQYLAALSRWCALHALECQTAAD